MPYLSTVDFVLLQFQWGYCCQEAVRLKGDNASSSFNASMILGQGNFAVIWALLVFLMQLFDRKLIQLLIINHE